ncbi:copper transporter 6-like [Magnolia sinica]|uniref:copper transporter 6-like n=1 Tax=Magnolia sinica TaxID=86752 RepID=UPI00265AFD8F|nr:copper transporter 6-like [Magnolia sinica]
MAGMGDHGGMGDGMNDGMMSMPHKKNKMMMHMTFFWGKDVEILFSGWPGHSLSMYVLALFFVFVLSVTVEWLSGSRLIRPGTNRVSAGLAQTGLHALRIGLAYMVMLAIMSFNAGVLIVAVAGHAIGFLLFGSRVFKPAESVEPGQKHLNDLPPMKC